MGNIKKSVKNVTCYKLHTTRCNGQVLIELLISLALLSLIFVSTSRLFVDIGYGDLINLQRVQAESLAEEGVAALKSIHERSWTELTTASEFPAHPVIQGGKWQLGPGVETVHEFFTRRISMDDVQRNNLGVIVTSGGTVDPSTKKFTIFVSWNSPRSLSLEKEIYLTRYLGNQTWTEDLVSDFINGALLDTAVTNEVNGEVRLDIGEGFGGYKGNRFSALTNDSVGNLDNANKKVSFRFTAQHTGDVDYIRIYINDNHPTQPPKYRFGLQSDLNGNPSGVWLGENHDAYKDYRIRTLGWYQLELEHDADLVKGTPYHLVVEYQSDQINPAKYIDLRALYPLNKIVPYSGEPDEYRMIRWSEDAGFSWTDINKSPVFMLIFEDNGVIVNAEGNPYFTAYDVNVYGENYKGQIFTYSDETASFNKLSTYVYVKKQVGATPEDNLYFQIKDLDTGADLVPESDRIFLTPEQVSVDYQLKEKKFANSLDLVHGHQYRLYFYSPGTAHNKAYQVGAGENLDQDLDNSINYLGTSSRYSESPDAGGSWTDHNNKDIFYQFSVLADTGYINSGVYISQTFDAGSAVAFNRVFWTSSIPAGTDLKFQVAVNSDGATWNFVGPDGTNSTYYTSDSSGAINFDNILGRYFKYKAYFATTDNNLTPVLDNFSLNYSL